MKKHKDDFDLNKIFEELEDVLSNSAKKESKHKEDNNFASMFNNQRKTKESDKNARVVKNNEQVFADKIVPLLEQIKEVAQENGMDFFFSMKTVERDGAYDITSAGFMEDIEKAEKEGRKPVPICEFLAMFEILNMPHEFSHDVIKVAMAVQAQMGLMNSFMDFLKNHNPDDSDDS